MKIGMMLGLMMLAVGCGGEESAERPATVGRFVGRLADATTYFALVTEGDQATAYLCNGVTDDTRVGAEANFVAVWLEGAFDGERVELNDGTTTLALAVAGDTVEGTARVGGQTLAANGVRATGDAGLYRGIGTDAEGGTHEGGWVVLADGSQRGGFGYVAPGGTLTKTHIAPTLNLAQLNVQITADLALSVALVGGL